MDTFADLTQVEPAAALTCIIMMGPYGGGKSTWLGRRGLPQAYCSADLCFLDEAGNYRFDPTKLSEAHGRCLREFTEHVLCLEPEVVVDNTNTSIAEIAPYLALATAFGYEVRVVMCGLRRDGASWYANVDVLVERNQHGVPREVIERQVSNLVKTTREWPRFWPRIEEAG